jgi:hypothetical protein
MWGHRVGWLPRECSGPAGAFGAGLRIAHDRFGSSSDPSINGHLRYPNDIDRSLNEAAADKIRKYRADCNNPPPNAISFMPAIASTSGRLHSEFARLLFLQAHRETDRFLAALGVQLAQYNQFSSTNIDGAPLTSRSHAQPSHSQASHLFSSSLSLGVPVPRQCMRGV